jgi:hypothetical protein
MARKGRRVLAQRRREHKQPVGRRVRDDIDPHQAAEDALSGSPERIVGARGAEDDAKRLRGLPVVGGPLGGAIPGTRPGVTSKLGRWRGALKSGGAPEMAPPALPSLALPCQAATATTGVARRQAGNPLGAPVAGSPIEDKSLRSAHRRATCSGAGSPPLRAPSGG